MYRKSIKNCTTTPTFWPHPSGDRLKVSKPVHTWAKNCGKSLPCQGNVAVAGCPEGVGSF
jgi:hypothetical protein